MGSARTIDASSTDTSRRSKRRLRATAGSEAIEGWAAEVERVFLGIRRVAGVVAGAAGTALMASEEGERLAAAGVIDLIDGRLRGQAAASHRPCRPGRLSTRAPRVLRVGRGDC